MVQMLSAYVKNIFSEGWIKGPVTQAPAKCPLQANRYLKNKKILSYALTHEKVKVCILCQKKRAKAERTEPIK